jgi:hypothetical protein
MKQKLAERLAPLRPWAPWIACWLVLGAWFVHPLWAVRVVPLNDLPNHLARITALHYLGDPRWNLRPFYERSIQLVPYLGHFYLVHLLAYIVRSVPVANLIFCSAYILGAPLCGLAFARATGRSPWLALLLLPLSVGYYFQWGFISFCAGVMLMLPAMAALYRCLDAPTPRHAIALGIWTAVLYLFHIVPWGALGLYAGALLLIDCTSRRWRGALLAALAMLPSVLLFLIGMHQARSIGYIGEAGFKAEIDSPTKMLSRIPAMLNWFQQTERDEWISIVILLLVILLIVTDRGPAADEPPRTRVRLPLAFALFVALAFVTPFWVKQPFNWWMINLRFLFPAACVALFLPRGPLRGARAGLLGAAVAVMLPLPAMMTQHYRDFSRRAWPLIQLIRMTPLGSNTLVLHAVGRSFEDPALAPQISYWREVYNYPLVYRGGFSPYLYDDGFPVKRIGSLPAPKVSRAAELHYTVSEAHFNPMTMMQGWDYFIIPEEERDLMPADGAVLVRDAGQWSLYKNLQRAEPPPPKTEP